MANRIRFELAVPAEVRQEKGHFVSFCPPLHVYSQGPDDETALANLVEALQLFVESCFSRGTLGQVLKDCGFEPDMDPQPVEDRRMVRVLFPLVANSEHSAH